MVININENGRDNYPLLNIIINNIVYIIWMILGVISCSYLYPVLGWSYLIFGIVSFVVLKKLVCSNCYYYNKFCGMGWGKLSALIFKRGDIERFNSSIGLKLAPIIYGLLTIFPIIAILISTIQRLSSLKILILIFLLISSGYSGIVGRKNTCSMCKMNLFCKGSAIKR